MVQVPSCLRRIGLAEEIPSKAGASCCFFLSDQLESRLMEKDQRSRSSHDRHPSAHLVEQGNCTIEDMLKKKHKR